jgi:hypothetical protein
MLVPARVSAPLRGCFRKGLTDSSLRAHPVYARKGKSGPFRPALKRAQAFSSSNRLQATAGEHIPQLFHLAESKDVRAFSIAIKTVSQQSASVRKALP